MRWIEWLKLAIDEQAMPAPTNTIVPKLYYEAKDDHDRILEQLTDQQLYVLLDLVQEEGLARGFGSWWWE